MKEMSKTFEELYSDLITSVPSKTGDSTDKSIKRFYPGKKNKEPELTGFVALKGDHYGETIDDEKPLFKLMYVGRAVNGWGNAAIKFDQNMEKLVAGILKPQTDMKMIGNGKVYYNDNGDVSPEKKQINHIPITIIVPLFGN